MSDRAARTEHLRALHNLKQRLHTYLRTNWIEQDKIEEHHHWTQLRHIIFHVEYVAVLRVKLTDTVLMVHVRQLFIGVVVLTEFGINKNGMYTVQRIAQTMTRQTGLR
jgi:hypothetical protein